MTPAGTPRIVAVGPTATRRPPAPQQGGASALLRLAGEAVATVWRDELGDSVDENEVRQICEWIAEAASAALEGQTLEAGGLGATVLGRRLLQMYRAELLRRLSDDPAVGAADVLALLTAVERVREATAPDWSQYFMSRLSGPDGLDLVVEVAHDLRSPLTSILFLAETLGRGQSGEVNDLQRRQLRLIYSAALGLSTMASDVIELARGGDQLVDVEAEPFSVGEVLESVVDMVRPIAEEKGLQIRFQPPATDRRVGRSLALSRVLLNLVTNALKFTDTGHVEITTVARDRSHIEFSVRDTGHGITPEALANLYQPFRRTRARAGRSGYYFSGTGLGLAMCRKIINAMGSELEYESEAQIGTRFFFELELPPTPAISAL